MTQLCVPIFVHSVEQAHRDAALAGEAGADIVEYRVDHFTQFPLQLVALVGGSPLLCIMTCRSPREGGAVAGLTDEQRIKSLKSALTAVGYIDVELETFRSARHEFTGKGR